jgi:hypothetical protein
MHQAKYTNELMKKFNMVELKPVSTLMSSMALLGPYEDNEAVDLREYKSMISSLLYLTATRLSVFPTLFASDDSSADFQVSQTHS